MRHFDLDFVEESLARIDRIPSGAAPRWGRMDKPQLIEHLIWALRHSMGRSTQAPFRGNFFGQYIIGPLYLRGLIPTPKNLRFPGASDDKSITLREPGGRDDLAALMREYVALVQADALEPAYHPIFGKIGIDGWDRLHVIHFGHHFKQFGVE